MNGAVLRELPGASFATPITGNGFVYGSIPAGVSFVPQGSAPAGKVFEDAFGDMLFVSETPYTFNWSDEVNYFHVRGRYRATNGLTVQGTFFDFPVNGGVDGILRADRRCFGPAGQPRK
jgi:hypothetical protein